ncbi:hypothetical protein F5141DRAFT_450953 [Pisolithus sp. B1]|nr:hypothetical protein F5141DRAFT_450953 [Pisolithus sp. B1]
MKLFHTSPCHSNQLQVINSEPMLTSSAHLGYSRSFRFHFGAGTACLVAGSTAYKQENNPETVPPPSASLAGPVDLLSLPYLAKSLIATAEKEGLEWTELKRRLTERTANTNVVGSLAVAACATFLTATPSTNVVDWTHEFPYICIGGSVGCALLSIITGLGLLVFLNIMSAQHLKSAKDSTFKRVLLLTLLMMPLTFLATAAVCAVVGWIGAAWFGDVFGVKLAMSIGCSVFFFTLFVVIAVMIY